jgi:hypothetical protein
MRDAHRDCRSVMNGPPEVSHAGMSGEGVEQPGRAAAPHAVQQDVGLRALPMSAAQPVDEFPGQQIEGDTQVRHGRLGNQDEPDSSESSFIVMCSCSA